MRKIIVIGCPGSGKTTFSLKLKEKTGLPLFHLDAIWHKADRTHICREEFDAHLAEILAMDAWIIDGDYSRTLQRRMNACDTIVFLDFPMPVCLKGAIARLGQKREDMPWMDTELDPTLQREIEEYQGTKRPVVLSLIEKYRTQKEVFVFLSREEADRFLDGINL